MDLRKLLSSAREQVLLVYDVTEEDVSAFMIELRKWLRGKRSLPVEYLRDDLLERFLMKNKFSIEKTKMKLENYCTLRSKHMIFYEKHREIIPSKEAAFVLPMFQLTDDLERIVICKIDNEQKFDFVRSVRTMVLILELGSRLDYSCGEVFIIDIPANSTSLISKINILLFRDAINLVLKSYPARIKAVHFINGSKVINVLMGLLKPLLPKKIYDRMHIHSSLESLQEIIPKKCLPIDYGGHAKCLSEILANYDLIFQECQDIFEDAIKIKCDVKMDSTYYPLEGTFRKLQID